MHDMGRHQFDFYIGDLHIHGYASPEALSAFICHLNVTAGASEKDIAAVTAKMKNSTDSLAQAVAANQPKE